MGGFSLNCIVNKIKKHKVNSPKQGFQPRKTMKWSSNNLPSNLMWHCVKTTGQRERVSQPTSQD